MIFGGDQRCRELKRIGLPDGMAFAEAFRVLTNDLQGGYLGPVFPGRQDLPPSRKELLARSRRRTSSARESRK